MIFNDHFFQGALSNVSIEGGTLCIEHAFVARSTNVKQGDCFVFLSGDLIDLEDAVARGAKSFIVAQLYMEQIKKIVTKESVLIIVPDVRLALLALAGHWRSQFTYPVIGIAGSVGKSSTKKIVANILDKAGTPYLCSADNNVDIVDTALTVLSMRSSDSCAIFEMGVSKRGQMEGLAALVRPTCAAIINIGHSNMEGLGSLVDIAAEHRSIFKYFTKDSIGIINGDLPMLSVIGYAHPVIKFGSKIVNQVQARKVTIENRRISFTLKLYKEKYAIELENTHGGEVFNVLSAVSIAHLLQIPIKTILAGIQVPVKISGRFEHRAMAFGKGTVINDSANANPESMKASLLAFGKIESKVKKVAVLGDMLGLGVNSPFWHRQLGRFLRKVPSLKHVVLIGDMVQWTKKTLPMRLTAEVYPTWKAAQHALSTLLEDESLVLVKGSTETELQNLVEYFAPSERPL